MVEQGQILELTRREPAGERLWTSRYRTGGRDSKRVSGAGSPSSTTRDALERELERVQHERRITRKLAPDDLVERECDDGPSGCWTVPVPELSSARIAS
jgi:hypothetical protein